MPSCAREENFFLHHTCAFFPLIFLSPFLLAQCAFLLIFCFDAIDTVVGVVMCASSRAHIFFLPCLGDRPPPGVSEKSAIDLVDFSSDALFFLSFPDSFFPP